MELLLTHGYFLEKDEREKRVMKPYPPLGILYLSSYLKSKGISVSVFDSTFRRMEDFTDYLKEHRPSIVGIYCNLMTKLNVLAMIRLCKSMGSTVLLGGPEPSSYAKEFLDSGADVIIIGEGEITTEAVMHSIVRAGVHRLHDVRGIAFRDE